MSKNSCIVEYLQAKYRLFGLSGKKPVIKNWQNTKINPFLGPEDFPKNFGVNLWNEDLVIDVDEGRTKDDVVKVGKKSFNKLCKDLKLDISKTLIVKTGSGGFHIYFKIPQDAHIKERWDEYPDLEFKSKGRYVVGAECTHPGTQKLYKIVQGSIGNISQAPANLLERIKKHPLDFKKTSGLQQYADDVQSISRCRAFLERAEGAVEGKGGDNLTYMMACRCRSFGLSPQAALDILLDVWNPKCKPPWGIQELKSKIYNAYQYDTNPQGHRHPGSDFKDVKVKKPKYKWNSPPKKDGSRTPTLLHTVNYFDISDELRGLLKYNLFTRDLEFSRIPIWYTPGEKLKPWNDDDAVECKLHLAAQHKIEPKTNIVNEGAFIVSKFKPHHPLRDYLNKLEWDGKERIGSWLTHYAGVKKDDYSQTVGEKTLLGAVARAFDPGCIFETVLIIEGRQGVGKSRLVKALGKDWYGDIIIDPHKPDTVAAMRNKWILEFSEMEVVKKTDINAIKVFLSKHEDRVRLAYRKNTEDFPRQCIFIGTINPDQGGGYLRDTTGNRRFWPVEVPQNFKIKVEEMQQDVDQIWAEAVHKYKEGMKDLHITCDAINQLAQDEAEKRRPRDAWVTTIKEWLNKPGEKGEIREHVTGMEVYQHALDGVKRDFDRTKQTRISQVMVKELGWVKGCFYGGKDRGSTSGYTRPRHDLELLEGDK